MSGARFFNRSASPVTDTLRAAQEELERREKNSRPVPLEFPPSQASDWTIPVTVSATILAWGFLPVKYAALATLGIASALCWYSASPGEEKEPQKVTRRS